MIWLYIICQPPIGNKVFTKTTQLDYFSSKEVSGPAVYVIVLWVQDSLSAVQQFTDEGQRWGPQFGASRELKS